MTPRELLLDTHVFLWMQSAPERLGPEARSLVARPDVRLVLSAVTAWEIAFKFALGRLILPEPPSRYLPNRMRSSSLEALSISHAHALAVADLPPHHRDPFDRLLIAQSIAERLPLLSADSQFDAYDIQFVDATT